MERIKVLINQQNKTNHSELFKLLLKQLIKFLQPFFDDCFYSHGKDYL